METPFLAQTVDETLADIAERSYVIKEHLDLDHVDAPPAPRQDAASATLHALAPVRHHRQGCPNCREFPVEALLAGVTHLYACQRLSARRIAALLELDRHRVVEWLRRGGVEVCPRGAGRRRPDRRAGKPANLRALLVELHAKQRRSAREVGLHPGMPERTVPDRLRKSGIRRWTRGRCNCEDRRTLPPELLNDPYVHAALSADEIGRRIGASRAVVLRSAHDLALPVRVGGPSPHASLSEVELIEALYADPLVQEASDATTSPECRQADRSGSGSRSHCRQRPVRRGAVPRLRAQHVPDRAAHRPAEPDGPPGPARRRSHAATTRWQIAVPAALPRPTDLLSSIRPCSGRSSSGPAPRTAADQRPSRSSSRFQPAVGWRMACPVCPKTFCSRAGDHRVVGHDREGVACQLGGHARPPGQHPAVEVAARLDSGCMVQAAEALHYLRGGQPLQSPTSRSVNASSIRTAAPVKPARGTAV
jgi:hypothetical protein